MLALFGWTARDLGRPESPATTTELVPLDAAGDARSGRAR
jgi:hypothetical protein